MHIEALRMVSRILAALVFICYLYQIVYLFVPMLKKNRPHGKAIMNRYAVLIAARNEENVLPYLLESIAAQDYPGELVDVYVVADNCTDGTAYTARKHGATVFERFNTKQIGKGYALNFLLGQMKNTGVLDNYDAFLVFDADNLLRPDYISQMNRTCSDGYEAFCGYRNSKNFADNWISAGYALWFIHDSVHLNQSRMLLGTTCAVSGTGFGFRRSLLEKCGGWHFFTLTEDIEFDTWCATHGVRIGFCREAMLYDEQPTSLRQSWRQRTRWVQGGIQVSIKYAAQLLRGILRGGRAGYASFETATLSLWGYGVSALASGLAIVCTFLTERWPGVFLALGTAAVGMYVSMLIVGALTLLGEWDKTPGSSAKQLPGMFTFPFFMMTFVPIAISAIFCKFGWQPIAHTVAVPVSSMMTPGSHSSAA